MAEMTLWACDWHDWDHDADSTVSEDDAYERGWVRFERHEFRETFFAAVGGVSELRLPARWHRDTRNVCPVCVQDDDCRAWLDGWQVEDYSDSGKNYTAATGEEVPSDRKVRA